MHNKTFVFPKIKMKKMGIAGIFLFGSQAMGTAVKGSDYDFAVLLTDKSKLADIEEKKAVYDELYDCLSGQIRKLCNIDIVFGQTVDLQMRFHIIKEGKLLYMGDMKTVSDFKETTMNLYADFAYFRHEFEKNILDRI